MCSYDGRLCLHKGSLSLPVWLYTVSPFMCLHVRMKIRKIEVLSREVCCVHVRGVSIACVVCVPCRKYTLLLQFLWPRMFRGFGFGPEAPTDDWSLRGICGQLFCYTYKFLHRSHTKALVRSQDSVCFCYPVFICLSECVCRYPWLKCMGLGWDEISIQSWVTCYLLLWRNSCREKAAFSSEVSARCSLCSS